MVNIVLREVAGNDITLYPVDPLPAPEPVVVWLYPVQQSEAPPLLVLTLDEALGGDITVRPAQLAPAAPSLTTVLLHSVGAPELPAGLELQIDLSGSALASAAASAALDVQAGTLDLAGDAVAGAVGDGQLGVGVDLAGDAVAAGQAQGELQQGINLAADAVASAQAEATLDGGGEEVPEAPWSGGFPILTPPRRRPRRKQDEDAIAAFVTIH